MREEPAAHVLACHILPLDMTKSLLTLNRDLLAIDRKLDLSLPAHALGEMASGTGLAGAPGRAQQLLPHHLVLLPMPEKEEIHAAKCTERVERIEVGGGGGEVEELS